MRIIISDAMKQGIPFFSLTESQWKLRQQHDQNLLMEGNQLQNKY